MNTPPPSNSDQHGSAMKVWKGKGDRSLQLELRGIQIMICRVPLLEDDGGNGNFMRIHAAMATRAAMLKRGMPGRLNLWISGLPFRDCLEAGTIGSVT